MTDSTTSSSRQPVGRNTPQPENQQADYNQLVEQLRSIEGINEDMATTIAENWQKLLGGLVVVLIAVWLYGKFQESHQAKHGSASAQFTEGLASFRVFSNRTEAAASDVQYGFKAKFDALREEFPETVYAKLAAIALAHADLQEGKLEQARQTLAAVRGELKAPSEGVSSARSTDAEAFVEELGALLDGKAMLAADATREEGLALLEKLVRGGTFLNVEALAALLAVTHEQGDMDSVLSLAADLAAARPELSELVIEELQNRGLQPPNGLQD